jgi:hypothetical protein
MSMCVNKQSYATRAEATEAGGYRPLKLYTYQCPRCGRWHLTKAEKLPEVRAKLFEVVPSKPESRGSTIGELLAFKRRA